MNEVQEIQFNMLIKFDEVCRKNGLRYYLAYGTCIGAMRHKGFIPWDHDVDVLMPYEDAIRLSEYQSDFGERYFVSNRKTDKTFQCVSMRLVDKEWRCTAKKNGKIIEDGYVSMDIYPFYNCPSSKIGLLINVWRSHLHKMLVGGIPQNHGKLTGVIAKILLMFFSESNRENDIKRIENKLNYKGESEEIADYFGMDVSLCSAITYRKEWFSEPQELLFEGKLFYGPTDPHSYLTKRYGDYMTPPSKDAISEEAVIELIKKEEN